MKKALGWIAGLTGVYILVSHSTNSGTLIDDAFTGAGNFEKTLQGR
jgi:hypothetical protein